MGCAFDKEHTMTQKRAGDCVYQVIRQRILNREWQPGMKIMSEPQLVREFGVSRVSVREAIEKLVTLGILEKVKGGGTFVRELSNAGFMSDLLPLLTLDANNYTEVLEFRILFEPACARMCAERGDAALLGRLQDCYARMDAHVGERDIFSEADTRFHLLIAEGSGNPLLHKVYEVFMPVLQLHQRNLYTTLKGRGGIIDHRQIMTSILAGDGELSELYTRRHIRRTMADMLHVDDDVE